MSCPVITISREFGSGGRIVAQRVAEELGLPFYDKSLIALAAKETGLSEEYIREAEGRKTSSLLYSLYMSVQTLPINDQVFIAESDAIRKVADESPCVIVGRCSDYVLRDHPNCLNVFIHAPLDQRIQRAKESYQLQAPDMKSYVLKQDKNRASYYEHFVERPWGKCQNFGLSLSSTLGLDTVTRVIVDLAKGWGNHA